MTIDITWNDSAREIRETLPHTGLADSGSAPQVVWEVLDPESEGWEVLEGGPHRPEDPSAAVHLRVHVEVPEELTRFVADDLPGHRVGLLLRASGSTSRGRAIARHDALESCTLQLELGPGSWRGNTTVEVHAVVLEAPETVVPPLPPQDALVWSSVPLMVVFDRSSIDSGAGFDVVWTTDLPEHQLYSLKRNTDGAGFAPQLLLNSTHPGLDWAWSAPGSNGRRAELGRALTAMIAVDVLVDLAVWAAGIDPEQATPDDIRFKERVEGTLIDKFKVRRSQLEGIVEEVENRDVLRGALQASKQIRLAESFSKVLRRAQGLVN